MGVPPKPQPEKTVQKGVSFPSDTLTDLIARSKELGFTNFSAYINALGQKDLQTPGGWLQIPPRRPKK